MPQIAKDWPCCPPTARRISLTTSIPPLSPVHHESDEIMSLDVRIASVDALYLVPGTTVYDTPTTSKLATTGSVV